MNLKKLLKQLSQLYKLLIVLVLLNCNSNSKPVFKNQNQTEINLNQYQSLVLYFFYPDCPVTLAEINHFKFVESMYRGKGIKMIGVIPGNEFDNTEIQTFIHYHIINFDIIKDQQKYLCNLYQIQIAPTVVYIDSNHVIWKGRLCNSSDANRRKTTIQNEFYLLNAIKQKLEKNEIVQAQIKPIGCFIE